MHIRWQVLAAAVGLTGCVVCAGLVSAAAPVRDAGGTIVGALNVSAPIFRVEGREEEKKSTDAKKTD